ncbi:MAG: monovalent cation/H+ antiporter complex subunit F [Salinivenus sp.]
MIELSGLAGWVLYGCFAAVGISLLLTFVRLLLGPSLPDRIIALDLVAYQSVALMVLYAVATDQPNFLDVALVLALIAFLGTVAFARYLEYQTSPQTPLSDSP